MAAYMLVQATVTDPEKFGEYAQKVPELITQFGGTYRVLGGNPSLVEGEWDKQSVVISEWPDVDAMHTFWNSPEYEEMKKVREGTGEFSVIFLECRYRNEGHECQQNRAENGQVLRALLESFPHLDFWQNQIDFGLIWEQGQTND